MHIQGSTASSAHGFKRRSQLWAPAPVCDRHQAHFSCHCLQDGPVNQKLIRASRLVFIVACRVWKRIGAVCSTRGHICCGGHCSQRQPQRNCREGVKFALAAARISGIRLHLLCIALNQHQQQRTVGMDTTWNALKPALTAETAEQGSAVEHAAAWPKHPAGELAVAGRCLMGLLQQAHLAKPGDQQV